MTYTKVNGKSVYTRVSVTPSPDALTMEISYPYRDDLATITHEPVSTAGMTPYQEMRELDRMIKSVVNHPMVTCVDLGRAWVAEYL